MRCWVIAACLSVCASFKTAEQHSPYVCANLGLPLLCRGRLLYQCIGLQLAWQRHGLSSGARRGTLQCKPLQE